MTQCFYVGAANLLHKYVKEPLILEKIYGSMALLNSQSPVRFAIEKERDSSFKWMTKLFHHIIIIEKENGFDKEEEINANYQAVDYDQK